MNIQDFNSSEPRRYVKFIERNRAYEQEKEQRKVLPHAPRLTFVEWTLMILPLLILICFALAVHFGLLVF